MLRLQLGLAFFGSNRLARFGGLLQLGLRSDDRERFLADILVADHPHACCRAHFIETTACPFLPHPRHRSRPLRSRTFVARLNQSLCCASGVGNAVGVYLVGFICNRMWRTFLRICYLTLRTVTSISCHDPKHPRSGRNNFVAVRSGFPRSTLRCSEVRGAN